jgi:hypothetical protein
MNYHDLHITTDKMVRTSIFNLPFDMQVYCTRVAGWQVWRGERGKEECIAGEYEGDGKGLRLDVAGHVILDTLPRSEGQRQDEEQAFVRE